MSLVRDNFSFTGMMAPTFAPLHEDGSVNVAIIPKYASFLYDNGVKGVFVNGSIGEGVSLTTNDRMAIAEGWVKCKDMIPDIIIHVGGTNISDIKRMAHHAETLGVLAISTLPPLYDKPQKTEDLVEYCREVSTAAPNTPLLYYHIPFKTGVNIPMDEFFEKAAPVVPSLSGMKFTSMEVETEGVKAMVAAGGIMTVLPGFDQTLSKGRKLGFPGAINGTFNFMPLEAGKLFCLAGLTDENSSDCCVSKGDRRDEIVKLQARLDLIWEIFERHSNGYAVSAAKVAMKLLTGVNVGPPKCPNIPLSDENVRGLIEDLKQAGFNVV